jgi:hypothetical protein
LKDFISSKVAVSKKSLKMPKGLSDPLIKEGTNNTMGKRTRTKLCCTQAVLTALLTPGALGPLPTQLLIGMKM